MTHYDLKSFENIHMSLWYKGLFQDSITELLIDIVEADESTGKFKNKISFLMAESFQNIVRHGLKDKKNIISGLFGVTHKSEVISIFSSNNIEQKYGKILSEKFDQLNGLTKDKLKDYYRQMINEGSLSGKDDQGQSLIEMARNSGEPIQHHFEGNGTASEFAIQIDKSLTHKHSSGKNIIEGVELYKQFKADGVLLFFKGDFDRDTTNKVVQILSENTKNNNSTSKLIFHASVELLQNITRHSLIQNDKKQGVFYLSKVNDQITISTINYVSTTAKLALKTHLAQIDNKTTEELSKLYKTTLRESTKKECNNAGVGLIDIAKYGAHINCSFKDTTLGTQATITATIHQ